MRVAVCILILCCICFCRASAQELFVFSEPASNMPAKSLSAKLSGQFGDARHHFRGGSLRLVTEAMAGINKNLMVHGAASFSNMYSNHTRWEGAWMYAKYRFLSQDELHRHFRMAAFTEISYARNTPYYEELNLAGDRSGFQTGIIATQLIEKFALSFTGGYAHSLEKAHHLPNQAFNYSLSGGLLVLPGEYRSFHQLNMNLYLEVFGQTTSDRRTNYLDLAPALQFIINSNTKINLGYRFQVAGDQFRSMQRYALIAVEHSFLNALR